MHQIPEPTPSPVPALVVVPPSSTHLVEEADRSEQAAMARYMTARHLVDIAEAAVRRADALARLEHSLRTVHPEAA
jgi:hypothetical protein